jgi:RHS repeat-associated protein
MLHTREDDPLPGTCEAALLAREAGRLNVVGTGTGEAVPSSSSFAAGAASEGALPLSITVGNAALRQFAESTTSAIAVHAAFVPSAVQPTDSTRATKRESSLCHLIGARWYAHALYRWMSTDPVMDRKAAISNPQLWNLYAYCENNPVTDMDPVGRDDGKKAPNDTSDPIQDAWRRLPSKDRRAVLLIVASVQGHHGVPRALLKLLPKDSAVRSFLEKWTTGELEGRHYFDAAHRAYSKAVEELTELRNPEVQQQLVDDAVQGAKGLGQQVLESDNPVIKGFLDNMKTTSGMTGREALTRTLAGDEGAAEELIPAIIETVIEDAPE